MNISQIIPAIFHRNKNVIKKSGIFWTVVLWLYLYFESGLSPQQIINKIWNFASLISGQMHVKYKLDFLLTLHSEPKAAKKNTFLKSRVSLNLGKCE